jgi:hypothetical protein
MSAPPVRLVFVVVSLGYPDEVLRTRGTEVYSSEVYEVLAIVAAREPAVRPGRPISVIPGMGGPWDGLQFNVVVLYEGRLVLGTSLVQRERCMGVVMISPWAKVDEAMLAEVVGRMKQELWEAELKRREQD